MNSTKPIHQGAESHSSPIDGGTLFGEYVRMVLIAHAVATAVMWIAGEQFTSPMTTVAILSSCWIVSRLTGIITSWIAVPVFTTTFLVACVVCLVLPKTPLQPVLPVFSLQIISGMLIVVLLTDIVEIQRRLVTESALSESLQQFVIHHGTRFLWYGIGGLIAVYGLVIPAVEEWFHITSPPNDAETLALDRMTLPQNVLFRVSESMAALFFFVVGCCVGSFLNVVVYRVPRGIPVTIKSSHCPGCSLDISARDNIPLIGWINLAGKCRNCSFKISPRYPIVELTVGLTFLVLFFVELISGGINLPGRTPNPFAGVLWILFYTEWDLVGLYLFHCILFCTVLSWSMIRRDHQRVPVRSVAAFLVLFCIAPLIFPHLLPYQATGEMIVASQRTAIDAAMTSSLGVAAGMGVCLLQYTYKQFNKGSNLSFDIASWILIGCGLGWQAVLGIFFLSVNHTPAYLCPAN